jgi:transcriptional regulator with GAF, ATPase, and Fis domain
MLARALTIETELFGHEKGAFRGAAAARRGKLADGGTLRLDAVGNMPLAMQAKVPRALEVVSRRGVRGHHPRALAVRRRGDGDGACARARAEPPP